MFKYTMVLAAMIFSAGCVTDDLPADTLASPASELQPEIETLTPLMTPISTSTPTAAATPTATATPEVAPTPTPTPIVIATVVSESSVSCNYQDCIRSHKGEVRLALKKGQYILSRSPDECGVNLNIGSTITGITPFGSEYNEWLDDGIYDIRTSDKDCIIVLEKLWMTEKPSPTPTPVFAPESHGDIWAYIDGPGLDSICSIYAYAALRQPQTIGRTLYGELETKYRTFNVLAKRHDVGEITDGEFWVYVYDKCKGSIERKKAEIDEEKRRRAEAGIWDLIVSPADHLRSRERFCDAYDEDLEPTQEWLDTIAPAINDSGSTWRVNEETVLTVEGYHEAMTRNCLQK